jgi:streptogramin lyase
LHFPATTGRVGARRSTDAGEAVLRRSISLTLLIVIPAAVAAPASAGAALTPTVVSFPASEPLNPKSHPNDVAAGPDGALWFTDPYGEDVGRITTAGRLTLQSPVAPFQYAIAAGADGAMWFVSQGPSRVSRIDAAGAILTKALPYALANPTDITSGPEGALWFTESVGKVIGRIPATTPLAAPDESRTTADGPGDIVAGPDGNLWFTEYSASAVGRMTPAGKTTYFPLPSGYENPEGIAVGPDGALWVTALNPYSVVRFETNGASRAFDSTVATFPGQIVAGPDGALWYTGFDKIARVSVDGSVEAFPIPDPEAGANGIAVGSDGNVWFAEQNSGRIGRITTPPTASTGAPEQVGARAVTVGATVNAHSQATEARVEYGPVGGATALSDVVPVAATGVDQPVAIPVRGLAPATAYRYRVLASNPTGSAEGAFSSFATAPAPRCKVKRVRRGRAGRISMRLSCVASTSVVARATVGHRLYGKSHARVKAGKAKLLLRPRGRARRLLRRRGSLRVKVKIRAFGGGTSTVSTKRVRAN